MKLPKELMTKTHENDQELGNDTKLMQHHSWFKHKGANLDIWMKILDTSLIFIFN